MLAATTPCTAASNARRLNGRPGAGPLSDNARRRPATSRPDPARSLGGDGTTDGGDRRRADDLALRQVVPRLELDLHLGPRLRGHPGGASREPWPWLLLDRCRT